MGPWLSEGLCKLQWGLESPWSLFFRADDQLSQHIITRLFSKRINNFTSILFIFRIICFLNDGSAQKREWVRFYSFHILSMQTVHALTDQSESSIHHSRVILFKKWTRICLSDAKKEGKQEPKADKESDVERAKANAALWRLRLDVAEQSLDEYRASTGKLAAANQGLTNQVYRSEKDMMDIMAHLKRKDAETDAKVVALKTFFFFQSRINMYLKKA